MKVIPLRTLLREPGKVKKLTNTGFPVQVTEHGKPLWIIRSVNDPEMEAERIRVTDEILDRVLRERVSSISAAEIVLESRGRFVPSSTRRKK
jgi:hypothetical protein